MATIAANPPLERFNRRDGGLLLVALAVAAVSLWVAGHYFHRAFPEASIDFRVSAQTSAPVAQAFLQARGLETSGYRHAEQFAYDDEAKTFLERELGLGRTEALLRSRIHLWRWEHRWFRPLVKEEYDVAVGVGGQVVGFNHAIADDAPGASLSQGEAQALAERYLTSTAGLSLGGLELVGSQHEVRAHRTDFTFTWKDREPLTPGASGDVAQAEYRHEIRVQGDEIGQYREYLRVPDTWERSYARMRSRNDTTAEIDQMLMLIAFLGLIVVLAMRLRAGDIRWRPALWVGGAGAVLSLLAALNGLSQDFFSYDTTQSFLSFLTGDLLGYVLSALGVGVFLLVLTAGGESLYRERFGGQIALEGWMQRRGLRSKGFFISMALGLALAALFFAYQTVFYLIANHFGAWAPADVPYDDLLNTRLPWAFVLFSGFFPAISEEFGFRMAAIPLFQKWFRKLWIAVVLASFLWGFGHANYPNEPFWIRGVEVGLGGLLLSIVMIRYGILATVVWHYTVDALYTAMLLLRAHDAYLRFSGGFTALLAVLPLAAAGIAYWRRGGFEPANAITNAAVSQAAAVLQATAAAEAAAAAELTAMAEREAPPPAPPEASYEPVSGSAWTLGILVAGALLAAYSVPLQSWSEAMPWRVSPKAAIAEGLDFLRAHGFDVKGDRALVTAATPDQLANGAGDENLAAATDIFHAAGRRALIAAFSAPTHERAVYYRVRVFRPLQEEEYVVAVAGDGWTPLGFARALPDAAPGGAPTLAQAQQRAEQFLAASGYNVGGLTLKSANQEQRPARTDSDFVWEQTAPAAGGGSASELAGAAFRVEVELFGGQVSVLRGWYHVPEERVRAYQRQTLGTSLLAIVRILMFGVLAGLVLWHLLAFIRAHRPWRPLIVIATAAGLIMLVASANGFPATTAAGYSTSQPWSAWLTTFGAGLVLAAVTGVLITLALLPPLAITAPRAWDLLADARSRAAREHAWSWDALWVGVLASGWFAGWQRVQQAIGARWHSAAAPPLPGAPSGMGNYLPGFSDWLTAPLHALWLAAFLGMLLPVIARGWALGGRRRWLIGAGMVLLWVGWAAAANIQNLPQLACALLFSACEIFLLWLFANLFLRNNPLAYLAAVLTPALFLGAIEWWQLGPAGRPALALFAAGLAAWLVWLAWHARHYVSS